MPDDHVQLGFHRPRPRTDTTRVGADNASAAAPRSWVASPRGDRLRFPAGGPRSRTGVPMIAASISAPNRSRMRRISYAYRSGIGRASLLHLQRHRSSLCRPSPVDAHAASPAAPRAARPSHRVDRQCLQRARRLRQPASDRPGQAAPVGHVSRPVRLQPRRRAHRRRSTNVVALQAYDPCPQDLERVERREFADIQTS